MDPLSALSPRRLLAMVRACQSAEARAQAGVEFVRACSRSPAAFLFLARGHGLFLAASSNAATLPEGLIEETARVWSEQLPGQPDQNQTLDMDEIEGRHAALGSSLWESGGHEVFEHRMLSTYREERYVPLGIVWLKRVVGQPLRPIRRDHIETLCDALLDAGDVPDGESR